MKVVEFENTCYSSKMRTGGEEQVKMGEFDVFCHDFRMKSVVVLGYVGVSMSCRDGL
jgi:hypothetical protein